MMILSLPVVGLQYCACVDKLMNLSNEGKSSKMCKLDIATDSKGFKV